MVPVVQVQVLFAVFVSLCFATVKVAVITVIAAVAAVFAVAVTIYFHRCCCY